MLTSLGVSCSAVADWSLTREQWSPPRSGEMVSRLSAIRQPLQVIAQEPSQRLLVRYPGGDSGVLWAHELRAWLIALGLESARIELQSGASRADTIDLSLLDNQP